MIYRRARYAKIQREVLELIERANVNAPPVPVEKIARMLGARIVKSDFKNEISGLLVRRGNEIVIGVAKEQATTRQRFTIAHEIGHLVLHEAEEVHVDREFRVKLRSQQSSEAVDVDEIEANAFAASLLMPEHFLRNDVRKLSIDFDDASQIQVVARRYGVSSQAMTFRLMNLMGE
jgi:Zn-dependent peptidase ImmA (M78 family)